MAKWLKVFAPSTFLAIFLATLLATLLSGCKQGEGDICQVDSDCESGLTCSGRGGDAGAYGVCQTTVSGNPDAMTDSSMDAPMDSTGDSAGDAGMDAMTDAGADSN